MLQPKKRLPGFGGDWATRKLGDLFAIGGGVSASRAELSESGISYLHYGDIHTATKNFVHATNDADDLPKLPVDVSSVNEKVLLKDGDVAFVDASEDLRGTSKHFVVINPDDVPFVAGSHVVVAKDKSGLLDTQFKRFCFQTPSVQQQFEYYATGSKVSSVSKGNIQKIEVRFPASIEEQAAIADCLSAWDSAIQSIDKRIVNAKQQKAALAQRLLSGEDRLPGFDGEWEHTLLKKHARKVSTKNKDGSINSVLTNSAALGIVNQRDYFEKDIANKSNLSGYYVVDTDDFVYNPRISTDAPVGPVKRNHLAKGVMSPLYMVFRLVSGSASYFEQFFQTNIWHEYMQSVGNSGARHDRMNISSEDFFSMPISIPSVDEQIAIASVLSAADAKIDALVKRRAVLQQQKQALMQQLLA